MDTHPFTDGFPQAATGLAVVDLHGRVELANRCMAALVGSDPNTLAGVGLLDLVHPDDRADLTVRFDTATHTGRRAAPAVVRGSSGAGGSSRWLQVVVHPITRAGAVDGFIVALGELTESLSMERRLDVLLARSDERIMLLGADCTILYASPAERRDLGAIHRAPFPWERLEAGGASSMRALFAATLAQPGLRLPITVRVRSDEGQWRVREVAMTNMIDDPGFGGIIVNSRDVTASGPTRSPYETSPVRQPTETVARVPEPLRSPMARLNEWVVVLEAEAGTNAMLCDRGTFQAILRALGDATGLYSPERYAVQIFVPATEIARAFDRALERWYEVALPLTPLGWSLMRAEILTREELDQELKGRE